MYQMHDNPFEDIYYHTSLLLNMLICNHISITFMSIQIHELTLNYILLFLFLGKGVVSEQKDEMEENEV